MFYLFCDLHSKYKHINNFFCIYHSFVLPLAVSFYITINHVGLPCCIKLIFNCEPSYRFISIPLLLLRVIIWNPVVLMTASSAQNPNRHEGNACLFKDIGIHHAVA
jgi:hypothetical protein